MLPTRQTTYRSRNAVFKLGRYPLAANGKKGERIDKALIANHLEVKVRFYRNSGLAYTADGFAFRSALTPLDLDMSHMSIGRLQSLSVIDTHVIAISAISSRGDNRSCFSGYNPRPQMAAIIDSGMQDHNVQRTFMISEMFVDRSAQGVDQMIGRRSVASLRVVRQGCKTKSRCASSFDFLLYTHAGKRLKQPYIHVAGCNGRSLPGGMISGRRKLQRRSIDKTLRGGDDAPHFSASEGMGLLPIAC